MQEIRSILEAKGYTKTSTDGKWQTWKKPEDDFLYKVLVPVSANTIYFYECKPSGSPISYIEFHNAETERQIKRLSQLV